MISAGELISDRENEKKEPILIPFIDGGQYGYKDGKDLVVITPRFTSARTFSEGLAAIRVGGDEFGIGGRWGYIDRTGNIVISPRFFSAKRFSEGLAAVRGEKKWGYINTGGKIVIPFQFDGAGPFSEELAAVKTISYAPDATFEKWGYIDRTGAYVIPAFFQQARSFSRGQAEVVLNGRTGFIGRNGTFTAFTSINENQGRSSKIPRHSRGRKDRPNF